MACVEVMTVVLLLLRRAVEAVGFSVSQEESTVSHLIDRMRREMQGLGKKKDIFAGGGKFSFDCGLRCACLRARLSSADPSFNVVWLVPTKHEKADMLLRC